MFTPNRASCKDCEANYEYKHRKDPIKNPYGVPPCITENLCHLGKPSLSIRNSYVMELYQKCAHQQIVAGMGQPIGIMFTSILALFDIYDIIDKDDRRELFEKIQLIDEIRLKQATSDIVAKRGINKK